MILDWLSLTVGDLFLGVVDQPSAAKHRFVFQFCCELLGQTTIGKAPGSHTLDVALSPDGKMLARAGTGRCELWDVASGKQLHTLKGNPHFYKVAFSPDGKILGAITGDVRADKSEVG